MHDILMIDNIRLKVVATFKCVCYLRFSYKKHVNEMYKMHDILMIDNILTKGSSDIQMRLLCNIISM